mgnify:CR=1 FL=1|tara:strand:+ start:185 stop:949 length:765 start_codon:yes stop_codon:yes gene_type:complete
MRIVSLFISSFIALSIFLYPVNSNSNSTGSPGAKTGSPLDSQSCVSCHSGNINSGPGSIIISTDIPQSGYVVGNTYTITITGAQANCVKFGFELTSEDDDGFKCGTFFITNPIETKTVNFSQAVTHTLSGSSGNTTKSWSMQWEAGPCQNGYVVFYAALVFANNNGNNTGDNVNTSSLYISQDQPNTTNELSYEDEFIFINSSKIIESKYNVNIFDINGNFCLQTSPDKNNISNLKSGIYILKSENKTQKIILN